MEIRHAPFTRMKCKETSLASLHSFHSKLGLFMFP
ncbi:hypothetical protein SOVF_042670 [Spinacia oleracea]|nr:hypothetical protein SOVF_042670 [Spinacia oleracea]